LAGIQRTLLRRPAEADPIVLTATSPFGHWVGLTHSVCDQRRTALIARTAPYNEKLASDRGVLLHEMIHAYLVERGEDPAHEVAPWCREIARLSALLGKPIMVEPQTVRRVSRPTVSFRAQTPPDARTRSGSTSAACCTQLRVTVTDQIWCRVGGSSATSSPSH
jgi:hypothetical protein